jgi:hypothetical protein
MTPRLEADLKAAGIPFVGLFIGSVADKSTWRVQFTPAATQAQQAQAATILAAFVADDPLADADVIADAVSTNKDLLATLATMLEKFDPTWASMTLTQKKAAVRALATRWAQMRRFVERNL